MKNNRRDHASDKFTEEEIQVQQDTWNQNILEFISTQRNRNESNKEVHLFLWNCVGEDDIQ